MAEDEALHLMLTRVESLTLATPFSVRSMILSRLDAVIKGPPYRFCQLSVAAYIPGHLSRE